MAVALEHVAKTANRMGGEIRLPPNQGKPWPPDEDAQLAREFEQSLSEPEMAQLHGRTQWAIVKRLGRLGKIPVAPLYERVREFRS